MTTILCHIFAWCDLGAQHNFNKAVLADDVYSYLIFISRSAVF